MTLYNSFIYPYITYGIEVWGTASDNNIKPIIILQKRAVRLITSSHYREHTKPIFKSLKLLSFPDVYEFSVAKLMFKIMKGIAPSVLNDMFTTNINIHQHLTRQSHKLHIPVARTNLMKRTFRHRGVFIWNSMMEKINAECSFTSYKKRLKSYLLNK